MGATSEDYQAPLGIDPNLAYPEPRPSMFTMDGVDYVSGNGATISTSAAKASLIFIAISLVLFGVALRR